MLAVKDPKRSAKGNRHSILHHHDAACDYRGNCPLPSSPWTVTALEEEKHMLDVKQQYLYGRPTSSCFSQSWRSTQYRASEAAFSSVLAVNAVPPLRRRFLPYGSRTVTQQNVQLSPKGSLSAFLDYLATLQVPHRYFTHFYVVSVTSSALWAQEILRNGRLFSAIAALAPKIDPSKAMSKEQILLTWALMSAQGCRRLYESIRLAKPSNAKMWFVHWFLGWAFYAGMGLAVWVEGIQTLRSTPLKVALSSPSLRTAIFLPLFLFASWMQNKCHRHLASLKKYSLPTHPFFRYITCPHYTAECLIYLSLAGIAAPPGQAFNKTILASLVFTAVNLGVTAETTRQWYVEKFGEDKVTALWRMIPFVY